MLVLIASADRAHAQKAPPDEAHLRYAPAIESVPIELRDANAPPDVEPQTSEIGPIALRATISVSPTAAELAERELQGPHFAISRYDIEGATRVNTDVLENALKEFTGPTQDFSAIQGAVATIEKIYSDAGFGAARVVVPEQDIDQGVVRLKLVEAKIERVEVTGQKFFSEENIRRSLPGLREGETPDVNAIGKGLRLANESTSKYTQITFRQSSKPELVDAVVRVTDAPTRRIALSLDNTGTSQTGYWRTGIAYLDSNVFGRDHALGLQYVTSPEKPDAVVIASATYRVPLYSLGAEVEAIVGHSGVNSGVVNTPAGSFGIRGRGDFAGLHYIYLLPKLGEWDQRVTLGVDWRYFKNDVALTGGDQASVVPNFQTLPVSVTYSGFVRNAPTEWNASIGLAHNIPSGGNGTTEAFQRPGGRANAVADYTIVRYGGELVKTLPGEWRLHFNLAGQYTREALIPGEQFALGGMDFVRGFGERAVANDWGERASFEIYTPPLNAAYGTQARALAFVDAGMVRRNQALAGEITRQTISSTGIGLRVNVATSAQLRVDSAFVLQGDEQYPRGSNRTHARLLYLF